MTCVIDGGRITILNKPSSPFSPHKKKENKHQTSMTSVTLEDQNNNQQFIGDSLWLSRKIINDGGSLQQTLQMMEERCKECSIITPMTCIEQCETWRVKKELHETMQKLSKENHWTQLLNSLKNRRRLTILNLLKRRPISLKNLQKGLKNSGFNHSQKTIQQYLKSLFDTGLIMKANEKISLTLYGTKITDLINKYRFEGQLPVNSNGDEERMLISLFESDKTRHNLKQIVNSNSVSRILKRLLKLHLIQNNSSSDRIFYFRSKRPTYLENISPTQKRICKAIPKVGISTRDLSKSVGINLRRTYKYLRNLRGRKLVFRREVPHTFKLTTKGRELAKFLIEISQIEENISNFWTQSLKNPL
jgi:predicted transcriptional regulator